MSPYLWEWRKVYITIEVAEDTGYDELLKTVRNTQVKVQFLKKRLTSQSSCSIASRNTSDPPITNTCQSDEREKTVVT